jgi:hypothetical protein
MLAKVLHQAGHGATTTPPDDTDLANLPRPWAFRAAPTETNPELLARIASIVGKQCFHFGWISALYTRAEDHSMAELKFDLGAAVSSASPDPDTDPAARRHLAERLAEGLADGMLIEDIRVIVAEQIPDLGVEELFSAVRLADGDLAPATDFLTALADSAAESGTLFNRRLWFAASGYPDVVTSPGIWLPDLLRPTPASTGALAVAMDPRRNVISVQSARLDVTPPLVWSDLALFSRDQVTQDTPPLLSLDGFG